MVKLDSGLVRKVYTLSGKSVRLNARELSIVCLSTSIVSIHGLDISCRMLYNSLLLLYCSFPNIISVVFAFSATSRLTKTHRTTNKNSASLPHFLASYNKRLISHAQRRRHTNAELFYAQISREWMAPPATVARSLRSSLSQRSFTLCARTLGQLTDRQCL